MPAGRRPRAASRTGGSPGPKHHDGWRKESARRHARSTREEAPRMTDLTSSNPLETKAADGDVVDAFGEFMATFETFKEANDEKLARLEKRADVLDTEKVDRIQRSLDEQKRAIDQLTLKRARPALGREGRAMPSEH